MGSLFRNGHFTALLLIGSAVAQNRPLDMQRSRYELRVGEPVTLAASADTVDFLLRAKTRSIEIDGKQEGGLAVGPNRSATQVLLAASPRLKPGVHTVKLSAVSETGEERLTQLSVNLSDLPTVPPGAKRPPVVLLNGWETGFTGACPVAASTSETFGNLAQYLISDGVPIVYLFDNCLEDPNQTIEVLAADLALFLKSIKYDDGSQVPQIDLVGHSMGGLIARAYLAGLQPKSGAVFTPPADTLVRKLILIATPNFGSFVAGNFANIFPAGTQSAELIPGSSFLWNLGNWNLRGDDLRGIDAIAVAGNAGAFASTSPNASDGLVSLTSASLGFVAQQTTVTRVVPYCHIDPAAFTNSSIGTFICSAPGIANVTDPSHLTGRIVRSFLADNKDWMTIGTSASADPYLSKNGGAFFALIKSDGTIATDVTQVKWGNVILQNGGATNIIYWDDMQSGTAQFSATSTSLGTFNCGSLAQVVGFIGVTRCKINATITTLSPLANTAGKAVAAGTALTINGASFGVQCANCKVTVTSAATSASQTLQITSWSATAIKVNLPATLTGLQTLTVVTGNGTDNITFMAVASGPTLAATSSTLQFSYAIGGAVPAAQTVDITASSGTLDWTLASSAPWLAATPTSATTPTTLSIWIMPEGLSAGTYKGELQLASASASNNPLSIMVTLTVTQTGAALAVTPQTLTFQYTPGGAAPAAQEVSIKNAGGGSLTWAAATADSWVGLSAASGTAPGTLSISVNPAGLAAGSYSGNVQITAADAAGSPATVAVKLVVQGAQGPATISAVLNGASFQAGIATATWVSIFGENLSPVTDAWKDTDFVNGALPTSLDGVSVTINGIPAYIAYISFGQINVLAPDDPTTGGVQVQVTTGQQKSNSFTAQKKQFAPAFFALSNAYVVALHADYSLVSSAKPAAPGEVIQVYGTGFGPTNPLLPTARLVTTPSVLANPVDVTVGGVAAPVAWAGEVGPGLYQLNVTVPDLPTGDAAMTASVGGVAAQLGMLIPVRR